MPVISEEELAELQAARDERDRLALYNENAAAEDVTAGEPPAPTHRALLADGSTYDYAGAHPTHVATTAGEIRVVKIHPLA